MSRVACLCKNNTMIEIDINSAGNVIYTQHSTCPSVYLDNWALMDISENKPLATRFINSLKERGGSLEISFINLLEFSEITYQSQIDAVESLLESISPNLCFIDVIPRNVIEREDQINQQQKVVPPHWDEKLLRHFATMNKKSLNPLSIKGLFSNLGYPKIVEMSRTFMQDFVEKIEQLREKSKNDSKYLQKITSVPKGVKLQRVTRYIYQDIINSIIRDNIDLSNVNHWRDMFHTIVPIAYCDFVLIDRAWAHKAKETIGRLQKVGQTAEMAQVFSRKNMEEFWKVFEN